MGGYLKLIVAMRAGFGGWKKEIVDLGKGWGVSRDCLALEQ